jgi:hypothetical protein
VTDLKEIIDVNIKIIYANKGESGIMSVAVENAFYNDYKTFEFDSRITYPSYKSFDEFIDLGRLLSLDGYLTERLKRRISAPKKDYFVNLYRLDKTTPYQPGVREIWLTRTKTGAPFEYLDMVDKTDLWEFTEAAEEFTLLLDFIKTLPFKETGRILIIYDDAGKEVPAHRDHLNAETCNEFIWCRTNVKKPFYVLNNETREKKYVESYSAWFDAVNQYHGSDKADGLSFSFRIDGVFTDEFKKQIPVPQFNAASTPALWDCISK